MKIVNRTEFLRLPSGTVYANYESGLFELLCIKGENCGTNDWFYDDLVGVGAIDCDGSDLEAFDLLDLSEKTGSRVPMNFEITGRDGCFDADQLFAVYERVDVEQLIERLKGTLTNETR